MLYDPDSGEALGFDGFGLDAFGLIVLTSNVGTASGGSVGVGVGFGVGGVGFGFGVGVGEGVATDVGTDIATGDETSPSGKAILITRAIASTIPIATARTADKNLIVRS